MNAHWTYCTAVTYRGSLRDNEPPEYCDRDAFPGEDFCVEHLETHALRVPYIPGVTYR